MIAAAWFNWRGQQKLHPAWPGSSGKCPSKSLWKPVRFSPSFRKGAETRNGVSVLNAAKAANHRVGGHMAHFMLHCKREAAAFPLAGKVDAERTDGGGEEDADDARQNKEDNSAKLSISLTTPIRRLRRHLPRKGEGWSFTRPPSQLEQRPCSNCAS